MIRFAFAFAAVLGLAACSSGGGGLAPGLAQRMDAPGAQLDRREALNLVNQFRQSRGVPPLAADPALDGEAQQLAASYAATGTAPQMPQSASAMRVSAGYANFAETFSGWRNTPRDAEALINPQNTRAGIGVAADPNSTYGVHWVMLFAGPATTMASAQ